VCPAEVPQPCLQLSRPLELGLAKCIQAIQLLLVPLVNVPSKQPHVNNNDHHAKQRRKFRNTCGSSLSGKTPILHREQFVQRDEYPHELEPLQPMLDPILRQHIQDCLHNFLVQRHQIGLADRSLPDPTRDLGDDGQEV